MSDIFISYSHADEAWKEALQRHLQILPYGTWDDRQIQVGEEWLPAIKRAIARAKVAILLVSSDFLASDFVSEQEIPDLLQKREQEGLRIVPVIVRPCAWKTVEWLASLQGATKDNRPLSAHALGSYELEEVLSVITERVHALVMEVKREESVRQAEAERLEQERLAYEAEKRRLAEERAQKEVDAKRVAEAKAAREREAAGKVQREAEQKRQAVINEQLLKSQQQSIAQQRIATLTDKLSKLYLQRDTETRVEEKFRLDALIKETESELAGLGASTSLPVMSRPPEVEEFSKVKSKTLGDNTQPLSFEDLPKPLLEKIKRWLLGGVLLSSVGGFGVWWVEYKEDKIVQPILPEMVNIPAGTFTMGCIPERDVVEGLDKCPNDELPAYEAEVTAFKIGKYEVTFDEWDVCTKAQVCPHVDDQGRGRGRRPVNNVSWNDVQVYLQWLIEKTGTIYRLPSEKEWEYAARLGSTTTAYSWGNSMDSTRANCSEYSCKDGYDYPATVASFSASNSGLYDIHGNVWEWVTDCYYANYIHAASSKNLASNENCPQRVFRGGSWISSKEYLRSAFRNHGESNFRMDYIGFRIAAD